MGKAFTVPEVLAVVAVIAIVMALLLPAVSNARRPVHQAVCANNNRQIITATLSYAAENRQWMPFANWINQENTASGWQGAGWLYKWPNNNAPGHQTTGLLWPMLREASIYRCPADKPPYIPASTHTFTSYVMNGAYCGYGNNPTFIYKRHQFAPNVIMFWEISDQGGQISFNDGSSRPNEPISNRHQTGLTVGCHDGHTEWMTYAQLIGEAGKLPGRFWAKPGSANGQ